MPNFTFVESPDSRQQTVQPPTVTLSYIASGEQNDSKVMAYAIANVPLFVTPVFGVLYRQDIKLDPIGFQLYKITVPYAPGKRDVNSFTFSFDTTGATINVKASKEHINTYPGGGNVHNGAIGVKPDGDVEGVDIIIPALKMTYTFKHPAGVITEAYAKQLAAATGQTNLNPFRSYDVGELLFAGATGSDGSEADAECGYQFIASQNATGLTLGSISSIAKQGHCVAWVEFKDNVSSGKPARQPQYVHIERVYDSIDFSSALGWG